MRWLAFLIRKKKLNQTTKQYISSNGLQSPRPIGPAESFSVRQLSKLIEEYDMSWGFLLGGVGLFFRVLAVVVLRDTDEQMQCVSAAAAVVQLENRFIIPACWEEAKLRAKSKCRGSATVESSRRRKKWQCKFPSSTYTLPHSACWSVSRGCFIMCLSTHIHIL